MDEMKKDTNLLNGKGENEIVSWITVNGAHIPIEEGESKKEAITKHFKNKEEQQAHLEKGIQQLLEWQRTIPDDVLLSELRLPKEKLKELATKIKNFEPITLEIDGREITAKCDRYTAQKNIYTRGNSSISGFNYKLNNVDKLPEIIKSSTYDYSKPETGKESPQHKGVQEWHYFSTRLTVDNQKFNVIVNIRDKGSEQFVYEVAIKQ